MAKRDVSAKRETSAKKEKLAEKEVPVRKKTGRKTAAKKIETETADSKKQETL